MNDTVVDKKITHWGLLAALAASMVWGGGLASKAEAEPEVEEHWGMVWPVWIVTETDPDEGYWIIFRSAGWISGEGMPRPPEEWDEVVHNCGSSWYRFWQPGYFDPDNLTEWEEAMGVLTPSDYYIPLGITYQCDNPDPDGEEHPDFAYVTDLEVAG